MNQEAWDSNAISQSLNADAQPCEDDWGKEGFVLKVGERGRLRFSPEGLHVTFAHPTVHLEMRNVVVQAEPGRLRLESEDKGAKATAFFDAKGTIIFNLSPRPEPAQQPSKEAPQASSQQSSQPQQTENKEREERVRLVGMVGLKKQAALALKVTSTGRKVLEFPLAVHEQDATTKYHTVVLYDENADKFFPIVEQARGLGEGEKAYALIVTGYPKQGERKVKKGKATITKTVQWVNAVAIQKPKAEKK